MNSTNDDLSTKPAIDGNNVLVAVFKAISVSPSKEEMQFVINLINGGKTDNTERASIICGYFDKEGNEKAIYDILEARWRSASHKLK